MGEAWGASALACLCSPRPPGEGYARETAFFLHLGTPGLPSAEIFCKLGPHAILVPGHCARCPARGPPGKLTLTICADFGVSWRKLKVQGGRWSFPEACVLGPRALGPSRAPSLEVFFGGVVVAAPLCFAAPRQRGPVRASSQPPGDPGGLPDGADSAPASMPLPRWPDQTRCMPRIHHLR